MSAANSNGLFSTTPSAKMRAVFVHPKFAQAGVGRAIMAHAENAARAAGFARAEVLATRGAVRLCARLGYAEIRHLRMPLADGTRLELVHMRKRLAAALGTRAA
jgi:N-acetylglutamate synthase-like GNAT family acetyltransferase